MSNSSFIAKANTASITPIITEVKKNNELLNCHDILCLMDPIFPYEEKQTIWQKITALPPRIKIVAILVMLIILSSGVFAFILWQGSQQHSDSPATETQKTEQQSSESSPIDTPATETNPDGTPKTEEQKKQ